MTEPLDPRLAAIARSLEGTRWGAELWDDQWRLAWVSPEAKAFLQEYDDEAIGIGRHIVDVRWQEPWFSSVDDNSRTELLGQEVPFIAADTPGGAKRLRSMLEQATGRPIPEFEAIAPPPMWARRIVLTIEGQPPVPVQFVAMRVNSDDGAFLGTAYVYGSTLPARL